MKKKRVFLDLETTGFDKEGMTLHEPVSIAVVDIDGKVLFNSLVKPSFPIPEQASKIHGITDADVTEAPTFKQALVNGLNGILEQSEVIIYNAPFDRDILIHTAWKNGLVLPVFPYQCAMRVYSELFGQKRFQKLTVACEQQGIDVDLTSAHGALYDAELTRQLWLKIHKDGVLTSDSPLTAIIETAERASDKNGKPYLKFSTASGLQFNVFIRQFNDFISRGWDLEAMLNFLLDKPEGFVYTMKTALEVEYSYNDKGYTNIEAVLNDFKAPVIPMSQRTSETPEVELPEAPDSNYSDGVIIDMGGKHYTEEELPDVLKVKAVIKLQKGYSVIFEGDDRIVRIWSITKAFGGAGFDKEADFRKDKNAFLPLSPLWVYIVPDAVNVDFWKLDTVIHKSAFQDIQELEDTFEEIPEETLTDWKFPVKYFCGQLSKNSNVYYKFVLEGTDLIGTSWDFPKAFASRTEEDPSAYERQRFIPEVPVIAELSPERPLGNTRNIKSLYW